MDTAGDAFAIWKRSNGSNEVIQAAVKPAGESWEKPATLSAAGEEAFTPQIAVDPAGDVIAAWTRSNGSNDVVQAAVKPAGGAWGKPANLSAAGQEASEPHVAVDTAGDATIVWRRFDGSDYIVQAAVKPAGEPWGNPANLSAAGQEASTPQVAVNSAGDATAVWVRYDGSNHIVQAAVKPAGGPWGTASTLSEAGHDASQPEVAENAAGDATAVWTRYNATDSYGHSYYIVKAAVKPAGKPWEAPATVSEEGQEEGLEPQVGVDAAGGATAVWKRFIYGCCRAVEAELKPVGEPWGPSATVSDGSGPRLAVDAAGDAIAIWQAEYGRLEAAIKPAGEAWGNTARLSEGEANDEPDVAVNGRGEATAVWTKNTGGGYGNWIVQAAQYSNAPFSIETLQKLSTEPTYTANELTGEVGDTVDYEIIVKNPGNATQKFVPLKDGGCERISPSGATELEAGKEEIFTCTHRLAGLVKYGNEASITGNGSTRTSNRVTVNGRESAPTLVRAKSQHVTSNSANFIAVLNPNGVRTQVNFWVSNGNQRFEYDTLVPASNEDQTAQVHVGGMSPGCTYTLEVEAFNSVGWTERQYVGELHTRGQRQAYCNMPIERTRPAIYAYSANEINSHEGLLEATIDPDGKRSTYEFVLFYKACQGSGCPSEYESHSVVAKGVLKAGYEKVTVQARPQVKPGCEYAFGLSTSNALGTNTLEAWYEGPRFTTYVEGLTEAHSCTP
jgi:hypothetical protein